MNELSRESRALLAAARHRDGLSAADKDRIRNKLTRRLGAGLALGSAVTASATVAEAARTTALATVATWLPAAAKVLGIVAIAGGVTVGAVRVSHHRAQPTAAVVVPARDNGAREISKPNIARELPQSMGTEPPENPIQAAEPGPTPAPVRELSTTKHEAHGANAASAPNEPAPEVVATPVDDGLSSQVAAIREARAAIRRGDGMTALSALDKGLQQGQGGPLEQEAILARVSALCLLGDITTARRTAEQFLARFPDSLLASRIRNSCAFSAVGSP